MLYGVRDTLRMNILKIKVSVEPELQDLVAAMLPHDRRLLAKKFRRWAHELEVTAKVIETQHRSLPPPKRIRWTSLSKAKRN